MHVAGCKVPCREGREYVKNRLEKLAWRVIPDRGPGQTRAIANTSLGRTVGVLYLSAGALREGRQGNGDIGIRVRRSRRALAQHRDHDYR